jgi:GNAT superfamily N-acetyltransferase
MVHRMIVDRAFTGRGAGRMMLDRADAIALELGRSQLALDAWSSNAGLHRYYVGLGFRHLRTVEGHHNPSSALFVRDVRTGEAVEQAVGQSQS